jgi:hypothetical protein
LECGEESPLSYFFESPETRGRRFSLIEKNQSGDSSPHSKEGCGSAKALQKNSL